MNIYSLWVDLCIMGADVQNLYSDISPHFYFVGVTKEMLLRDLPVSSCVSVYKGLFIYWKQQEVKVVKMIKRSIVLTLLPILQNPQ